MKQLPVIGAIVLFAIGCAPAQKQITDMSPTHWANTLMGTQSTYELSHGNTYPAVSYPWGMNSWTPQTGKMGDGWVYTYTANKIRGFKQTHQPSPWINDYGQFSIFPLTGKPTVDETARASWFSHKTETAKPYLYSVYLADYHTTVEMAPSERCASFLIHYPDTDSAYLVVDGFDGGSSIELLPDRQTLVGYSTKNSGGVPANFKNHFTIKLSDSATDIRLYIDGKPADGHGGTGNHVQALLRFRGQKDRPLQLWVASSFIDQAQAQRNLLEVDKKPFSQVLRDAQHEWDKWLGRIQIEGGTDAQKATFYSCLYRTMLFPRKFYEIGADGQKYHYSPYNGRVEQGVLYTDNGFWDTFRAQFPLINLIAPSLNQEIQEGLANTYKESGWLPEWASPGHRDCMIGSNSASIVAEAWLKGCRGYDIDALYQAMLKNTRSVGPLNSVGRLGAEWYNRLGYVPYDVGIRENAARTLEYAYADFAIMQLAKALGRPQAEIDTFARRCLNYKNLFDPTHNLMRGKNADGSFQAPFNPFKWGDAFTEGNSLHYSWSVFHDIEGLIGLMGGRRQFTAMLDTVFALPPVFDDSYYGFTIHEIREMQIMGMGNYAHGNQPIQHMPYLYNYAGQPWKSQFHVRQIMDRLYSPGPDGYCGDEDNGQTSAWYVFSALGFYPVTPVSDQFVLGSPLFKKATIYMENGKTIEVNAPANSPENVYIQKLTQNGKNWPHNYLDIPVLNKGARLDFELSPQPNDQRGTSLNDAPYSFSKEK
ncbi:MAG: GH92 family glycosyl hydrolase [Breznakibacter sp.]